MKNLGVNPAPVITVNAHRSSSLELRRAVLLTPSDISDKSLAGRTSAAFHCDTISGDRVHVTLFLRGTRALCEASCRSPGYKIPTHQDREYLRWTRRHRKGSGLPALSLETTTRGQRLPCACQPYLRGPDACEYFPSGVSTLTHSPSIKFSLLAVSGCNVTNGSGLFFWPPPAASAPNGTWA